ncbi:hypothetical protein K7X08_009706 [Anisodus acutangulus]|uniref:Uncharacterized protein n=1 Tax=Anisodus acutangulus TaxID=402998 RepID=A0A9Q1N0B4_9SOLA|nr:hypothetical protein K7X08_009706 [Anisodus acutangulus]
MTKDDNVIHVVMLPWAAFGHLIPFFNLSTALAEIGGIHVSFISTPKNIKRLPKVPPNLTHLVKLVEFPMPVLDDKSLLPEDAEASVDVPSEKIQYLKAAYDLLEKPIKHFIANEKPDWIIADFAQHWVVDIAETYDIPLIYYCIFGAAATGFSIAATSLGEVPEILTSPVFKMLDFPSTLAYRKYESLELMSTCFVDDASGFNARFLMEKGLGIAVERNEEDGSFSRNEIAKALTYAMVSKEGEGLRDRAKEAAAIFEDQNLHDSYIAKFIEYLKNNREDISTD